MLLEANKVPKIPASKWSNQWGGNVWSYTASQLQWSAEACLSLTTIYIWQKYMYIVYRLYVYYCIDALRIRHKVWHVVTFGLDRKRLVFSWCQRIKYSAPGKMNLKLLLIFKFLLIKLVFVAQVQLKQRKSMFSAQTLPGPLTNFGIRNMAESFAFIIDRSALCTTVTLIWSLTNWGRFLTKLNKRAIWGLFFRQHSA